jgi:hypothetical protein
MKPLMIAGLALTVAGALLLAWVDLTAKRPTWDSLVTEWQRRRKFATTGFALIAIGTALQIVATISD